ncbi:MAG: RagB/SusD family nutrient uptake outer membrane protein, partial [Sphingobacteriales bacterium]
VKYVPDFTNNGQYYGGPAGNWLSIFRYADVVLMVAEARMQYGGALQPIQLFREEHLRAHLIKERGNKTVASGL